MALPLTGNITLLDIQNEFGQGSLAAASTPAGLDPLPTSMRDFMGLSAVTASVLLDRSSGSGTFTIPAGVTSIWVLVVGGGAGGGGARAGLGPEGGYRSEGGGYSANAGGGGGAGEVSSVSAFTVVPGQTISWSVGAGGVGGIGSGLVGSGGTTFALYNGPGGGTILADGGTAGQKGLLTNADPASTTLRGNGGDGGNGVNFGGQGSNDEWGVDSRAGGGGGGSSGNGGSGATSFPGAGGAGTTVTLTGLTQTGPYGVGGDGGTDSGGSGAAASFYGNGGAGGGARCFENVSGSGNGGAGYTGRIWIYG